MTYLELVNGVLRRLRESEVTTVTETAYSSLIGDIVNDAKVLVENAWDWSALRTTIQINTVDGTKNYSLTGTGWQGKELNVINDTSNLEMEYRSNDWFDRQYFINTPASGAPEYFTWAAVDGNGDQTIDVYPLPDGVYNLRFDAVVRNAPLTTGSTELAIPDQPVLHLAVALASRERGETGGTSTAEYFDIANQYLQDAIALDAATRPEEMIWYTP